MYEKIKSEQNFTFSMEEKGEEIDYKVSMSQKGNDVSIDMYSDGEHTTTLILKNASYYIMHEEQEYYDFGGEEVDADILIDGLQQITQKKHTTGNEEIDGSMYYYEEFENDGSSFIIFPDINEDTKIKTRFYFDGDNIKYIKNIITNNEEKEEELIKAELKYSVDEKLFQLPEDYAEAQD